MHLQDGYSEPVFGNSGYCILDFQLRWMMDAIHYKDPEKAGKYAHNLYHNLFLMIEGPQRLLFPELFKWKV